MIQFIYGLGEDIGDSGNGLREIASRLKALGHSTKTATWNETAQLYADKPEIIIAHSYGGAAAVRYARKSGNPIKLLILTDPVPRLLWGQFRFNEWKIPETVNEAVCFYQKNPITPLHGQPIRRQPGDRYRMSYDCTHLGVRHLNLPEHEYVIGTILGLVGRVAQVG